MQPMFNLTHHEAIARKELIGKVHYHFAVDLTADEKTFPTRTKVTFEALKAGSTFIDLRVPEIHRVTLDGEEIGTDLHFSFEAGEHELVVEATGEFSHTGQGLHRFVDPADGEVYFYTQFETADAKRVFACFDQPDIKATYQMDITAPSDWEVITNSPQEITPGEGSSVFSSRIDYPLSTYLVAICAGPYAKVADTWTGTLVGHDGAADEELSIPLGLYCRKSLAGSLDAETLFTETKQGFDYYHAHFGYAYPFGKYDQLFVPEFNAGAMENAGAVTFRDEYVFTSEVTSYLYERRCETLLHEMAHMWFGDLVTMSWWDDLWLNESFATWAAAISQAEATQYSNAWVTFANVEKSWAYQQDMLPTTHPISTDASDIETVEQNFDGITYAKGASVLKQLQAYVGREAFFKGVRKHFATHAFGNATFDDLLGALEEASGRDLSNWASQWLKTTGINTLAPKFSVEDGCYSSFAVTQSGAQPGAGELRTHRICVGLYSLDGDKLVRTKRVELDVDSASQEVPELIGVPAADVVLVNDEDLTYCMMGLDEASAKFVVDNIDKFEDPMPRTLCWSACWELTREGVMPARDFVSLVIRGMRAETEISVLQRVLMQTTYAIAYYGDGDFAEFADALVTAAEDTTGDFALAYTQALGKVPLTEKAAAFFEEILAGTEDADLKWVALTALVGFGRQGEDEITALELIDQTSSGHTSAIRARAALVDSRVKEQVFEEIATQKLGNLELRHKVEGLRFAFPFELLQPLSQRFYDVALDIWEDNSSEVAAEIIGGLFPSWDISEEGVQRAATFLEQELPGGLRRKVAEGKAELERSLRNRGV